METQATPIFPIVEPPTVGEPIELRLRDLSGWIPIGRLDWRINAAGIWIRGTLEAPGWRFYPWGEAVGVRAVALPAPAVKRKRKGKR